MKKSFVGVLMLGLCALCMQYYILAQETKPAETEKAISPAENQSAKPDVQKEVKETETKETAAPTEGQKNMTVANGTTVKVHYKLTVDDKVMDSSEGKEPLEFKVGVKQMIPGFEKAIMGMKIGEKKSFEVLPEEGYGKEDPQAFQEVPKAKLPKDITPQAGMTLYVKGPDDRPYPVKIQEVKDDTVIMNFNHPLAGKTLKFEVEVVDIK